jgi:hypothetical protein
MGAAEDRLNYPVSERTRFRVRVEINEDPTGEPLIDWARNCHFEHIRNCRSLEEAQRGYIALRNRLGYGASQFGFGEVFDEAGQLVATISYNGRLWAPSPDGRGAGWRPGADPVAEAPITDPREDLRGLLAQLVRMSDTSEAAPREADLHALGARAGRLLSDPRLGLNPERSDRNGFGVQVWAGGPAPRAFTHGPSPHLGFLGDLNEGDVVQGFNGRGDVLTEGVKTRDGVVWRRVHGAELDRAREVAADRIFELAELGGAVILDSGGWEWSADEWVRPVFLEPEEGEGDSLRGVCVLRFRPNSDQAASLSLDGEEMLLPEQAPDYPVPGADEGPETGMSP